ncbi:MAG: hypothetical protein QOI22_1680 [Verrucomicrobiota bacterium]
MQSAAISGARYLAMDVGSEHAVPIERADRFFLLVGGALCAVAAVLPLIWRLLQPLAVTPWEAQIAMEGVRFSAGLPLYEQGHATHLYGPLLSVVLGLIFKVAGLSLVAARAIFSVAGIGLALLLALVACRTRSRESVLLASLFFLALGWRTNFVFYSTQPDCLAALFAIVGLLVWIKGKRALSRFVLGLALLLCAMLFKQTSAAFSLIPLVHILLWERPLEPRKLFAAMIPPIFLLLALLTIAFAWPQLFAGLVIAPARLKVHYDQFAPMFVYLLGTFPLFFLALFLLLGSGRAVDRRERWIISANVVLIPISVWTTIKSGGGLNSLLFAYLAMAALVASQLERIFTNKKILDGRRVFGLVTFFMALLCSLFFQYQNSLSVLFLQLGDDKYERVVALAREFGPGVVSPQDTTIAFRANGYIGRSLFLELDRHSIGGGWPPVLPESMKQELANARYIIELQCYVPTPMFHDALVAQGFERESVPALESSAYTLWARRKN